MKIVKITNWNKIAFWQRWDLSWAWKDGRIPVKREQGGGPCRLMQKGKNEVGIIRRKPNF